MDRMTRGLIGNTGGKLETIEDRKDKRKKNFGNNPRKG